MEGNTIIWIWDNKLQKNVPWDGVARDVGLAIAKGAVAGHSFISKFGDAPDFDTTDGEVTIWDGADDATIDQMVYQYSSSADIDSIVSSDAGDVQEIEIQGLDANFFKVTQTTTLNGQTRVVLATNLIRVFRLKNMGATNVGGNVSCYVDSAITNGVVNDSAKVRALINNGFNQTLMCVYTVPAGKTGYLEHFFAGTTGPNKSTNYIITVFMREEGGVFQVKNKASLDDSGSSHFSHVYPIPLILPEKTDIEMRAIITAAGVTGSSVSAGFDIILVDN